jgi:hypothetical protein
VLRQFEELKLIAREVSRRGTQLTTAKKAAFRPEAKVWFHNGARRISSVVERTEGAYVVVKLQHGFVARIALDAAEDSRSWPPSWTRNIAEQRSALRDS